MQTSVVTPPSPRRDLSEHPTSRPDPSPSGHAARVTRPGLRPPIARRHDCVREQVQGQLFVVAESRCASAARASAVGRHTPTRAPIPVPTPGICEHLPGPFDRRRLGTWPERNGTTQIRRRRFLVEREGLEVVEPPLDTNASPESPPPSPRAPARGRPDDCVPRHLLEPPPDRVDSP